MATLGEINAKTNGLVSDIHCCNYRDFQSGKRYDFILSNPPFYNAASQTSNNTHKSISRSDAMLSLELFFQKSNSLLSNRGELIFCYLSEKIGDLLCIGKNNKLNLESLRFVHSKIDKPSKLALFCFKKNSKTKTTILPPLITHDDSGNPSSGAKEIFAKCNTHSIKCAL
jgi:tRNA1(Val) A37 N6-methylase TrmN6